MNPEEQSSTELAPLNRIRVETALSRYPIHRLSKTGQVAIDIRDLTDDGEVRIRWEVSHNSKYGQPGPLAYKLDTLIVNRRIEEASRPIPRIIKLGCLKEICRELNIVEGGSGSQQVKKSLHQNASTYITSKIRYRLANGRERNIEFGGTRYNVIFTGESLPDGRTADAVYIVLHDFYKEILDNVMTRPLDYDYLSELAPAPQRLYELLSYQMFAALKHDRPRAKLLYSELCSHGPQTRYFEFDKVKKQMFKIHQVHVKSGYIAKINYDQTTDADGKPDWVMLYQPGARAVAQYQAFAKRGGNDILASDPLPLAAEPAALPAPAKKARKPAKAQALPPMAEELVNRGVTPERAGELVELYPERIERQLEILDWYVNTKPGKITDPAAYLVKAIERNNAKPKGFVSQAERERQRQAQQAEDDRLAASRRADREAEARDRATKARVAAYRQSLSPEQLAQVEAEAIAAASDEIRESLDSPAMRLFRQTLISRMIDGHLSSTLEDA